MARVGGNKSKVGSEMGSSISSALERLGNLMGEQTATYNIDSTKYDKKIKEMEKETKEFRKTAETPIDINVSKTDIFNNKAIQDRINQLKKSIGDAMSTVDNGGKLTPERGISVKNLFKDYGELSYYLGKAGEEMDKSIKDFYEKIYNSVKSGANTFIQSNKMEYVNGASGIEALAKKGDLENGEYIKSGRDEGISLWNKTASSMKNEAEASIKRQSAEEIEGELKSLEERAKIAVDGIKSIVKEGLADDGSKEYYEEKISQLREYLSELAEVSSEINNLNIDGRNKKLSGKKDGILEQIVSARGVGQGLEKSATNAYDLLIEEIERKQKETEETIRNNQNMIEEMIRDHEYFGDFDSYITSDWIKKYREKMAEEGAELTKVYKEFEEEITAAKQEAIDKQNKQQQYNQRREDLNDFIRQIAGGDPELIKEYAARYKSEMTSVIFDLSKSIEDLKKKIVDELQIETSYGGDGFDQSLDDEFEEEESEATHAGESGGRAKKAWEEAAKNWETVSEIKERIRKAHSAPDLNYVEDYNDYATDMSWRYEINNYVDAENQVQELKDMLDRLNEDKAEVQEKISRYEESYTHAFNSNDEEGLSLWGDELDGLYDQAMKYDELIGFIQNRLTEGLQNFKPGDSWGENEINVLIALVQKLVEELSNLSKAFGQIDDESGIPNLLEQLRDIGGIIDDAFSIDNVSGFIGALQEISEQLSQISLSIGIIGQGTNRSARSNKKSIRQMVQEGNKITKDKKFGLDFNIKEDNSLEAEQMKAQAEIRWKSERERYKAAFNKLAETAASVFNMEDQESALFGGILSANKAVANRYQGDLSTTFGNAIFSNMQNPEDVVQRIMDFFSIVNEVLSSYRELIPEKGVIKKNLKLGDSGKNIRELQRKLKLQSDELGDLYNLDINEKFDDATKNAVVDFQKRFDIKGVSGEVNQTFMDTLDNLFNRNEFLEAISKISLPSDNMKNLNKVMSEIYDVAREPGQKKSAMQKMAETLKDLGVTPDIEGQNLDTLQMQEAIKGLKASFEELREIIKTGLGIEAIEGEENKFTSFLSQIVEKMNEVKEAAAQMAEALQLTLKDIDVAEGESALSQKIQEAINSKDYTITLKPSDTLSEAIQTLLDSNTFHINIDGTAGKSNGLSPADLISQMTSADSMMQGMGVQSHERAMAFNSQTGYHTNPFVFDQIDKVRTNVVEGIIKSATEEIDTLMHTHPDALFPGFSLANLNKQTGQYTGDLLGFYGQYKKYGINTQINAAQNGVSIFNAKDFYDVYGNLFEGANVQETAQKLDESFKKAFQDFRTSLQPLAEVLGNIDGFIIPVEDMVDNVAKNFPNNKELAESLKTKLSEAWKTSEGSFDSQSFTSEFMKYIGNLPDDYGKSFHQAFGDFIKESLEKMDVDASEIESYLGDGSEFLTSFKAAYHNWFRNIMKADTFLPKAYEYLTPQVMKNALGIKDFNKYVNYMPMDQFRKQYSVPSGGYTDNYSSIINSARSAAAAKEDFSKANKEAAQSVDPTVSKLEEENMEFNAIGDTAERAAESKDNFSESNKNIAEKDFEKIKVTDFTTDLYDSLGIKNTQAKKQIKEELQVVLDELKKSFNGEELGDYWTNEMKEAFNKLLDIIIREVGKTKNEAAEVWKDFYSQYSQTKVNITDDMVKRLGNGGYEEILSSGRITRNGNGVNLNSIWEEISDKYGYLLQDVANRKNYDIDNDVSQIYIFIEALKEAKYAINQTKESYDKLSKEMQQEIRGTAIESLYQTFDKMLGSIFTVIDAIQADSDSTSPISQQTEDFIKRSKDVFEQFGRTQHDIPIEFQELMNELSQGSIDADEALRRLRDTLTELKKAKEGAANTPDGSKEDAEENREAAQAAGEYTEELKKQTKEMRERAEAQREMTYGEGGVYINQRDFKDPENDYYYTERTGRQQFQKVHVTHQKDADGNLIYDENGETIEVETRTTITNFKALEEEVIRVDKQIIKLQNDLSNTLQKGMPTDGIQTQLKLLQSESKALVTELYSYYNDNNYMPDNPQVQDFESRRLNAMTMEYSKVLQKSDVEAFNSQKRLNSEIERTDALIEQLKGKLERMKKIYQDNVNINFTSEADDKYREAEEAINRLQGKVSPKVEKVQAQNAIDEYVRELKQQAKDQKVSTQFDPYSIDAATEKLKTNVNMLDREMEKAKFDTDDLETKLDKLKEALKTTFTAEGIKQLNNEFRSLREQFKDRKDKFDMSGQAEKTQKDYRLAIDALQDYKRITNEINKITIKELTNGQKDVDIERKNELLQQQAKAAETARNAMIRLNEMRNNGDITDSQIRSAGKLYREGKEGTMISQTSIANAQVKANRKELENFEGILQEYEDAVARVAQLEGQLKMSGGGDLEITAELEEARKKADETAVALEGVKNALNKDYISTDYKYAAEYRMMMAEQERKSPERSESYAIGEYQGILIALKKATEARDKYNKILIEEAKGNIVPENYKSSIIAELEQTAEAADKAEARLEQLYYTEKKITEAQFTAGKKDAVLAAVGTNETKNNLERQLLIKSKKDVDSAIKNIEKYYDALKKASEMQDKFYEGKATSKELNAAKEKANGLKEEAMEGRRTVSRAYTTDSQIIDIEKMREIRKIFSEISEKEQSLNNTDLSSFENLLKNVERYTQIKQKEKDGTPFTYNDIKFLRETGDGYDTLIQKVLAYREAVANGDDLSVFQDELDMILKFGDAWDNARAKAVDISVDQMEQQINKLRELDLNNMGQESLTQIIDKFATLKQTIEATGQTSKETENVMKDMQRLFNSFNSDQKGGFYTQADEVSVERLRRRMSDWMSNNTVAVGATQQIKNLQKSLDGISVGGLKDVEAEFERIKERAAAAGQTGKSFGDALKKSFSGLARYMATYVSFYRIIGTMRQAINIVKELDKGLTEVRKVTSESLSDLKDWQMGIFDSAEKVGTTAQQIQESTASWLRLGKTFEEANEAAQASSWLLNVSEFENINDATTALVSITQAFKDLSFEDVIDKLNAVGDSYSSATNQLASGLQNSAAVLKVQGNDINKSLALLTAGKSLPENVETYFKYIFNCVERLKTYTTIMKKLHYESLKTYVQCG